MGKRLPCGLVTGKSPNGKEVTSITSFYQTQHSSIAEAPAAGFSV